VNQVRDLARRYWFHVAVLAIAATLEVVRGRERAVPAEAAEGGATQAEREGDTAGRIAMAEERTRIASELPDIAAHAVSVMVLQVGAVRHDLTAALSPDREALTAVA